ncbi:hypothetical protein Tco_0092616 [Tanacetum coccineum]
MVTPQEFMNGAVKQLVGSIWETEPLFIASSTKQCERVTNDEEAINFWKQGFVEDQDSEEDSEEDIEDDSEEDMEDDMEDNMTPKMMEKSPMLKKPMVAENEKAIAQKAIVTVKKEKDVEQDATQAVQKDEEPK